MIKRLVVILLCFALVVNYVPVSLAAGEMFNAETMTISGLTGDGTLVFGGVQSILFTAPSYTFEDSLYDTILEGKEVVEVKISYGSTMGESVYLFPRHAVPSENTSVVLGDISNLSSRKVYQYSLDDGKTWITFTSTIGGTFHIDVDTSKDTEILLRRKADLTEGIPASYAVTLVSEAIPERDEEVDDLTFAFNIETLTFTGLRPGMTISAKSLFYVAGDMKDSYTIPDADYDALFAGSSNSVKLIVFDDSRTYLDIDLLPRPATPSDYSFDVNNWTVYGLNPNVKYEYASPDMVWGKADANAQGELKIGLKDRSGNYKVPLRVSSGANYPPSYAVQLDVPQYILTKHVLDVDVEAELIWGFDEEVKYEYSLSTKPDRWSALSVNKRGDLAGSVKMSKFIPRTGKLTVSFREKADRGAPVNEPFDALTFAARPLLETKTEKLMISYTMSEEEMAMVKYSTDIMEFAEKPERGDPYDWELGLNEAEFDLPEKSMRIYIRVSPADDAENLVRGECDVFTPASKIKNLTIKAPARAPNLKIVVKTKKLTIKKDMEYWINGSEPILVTDKKGVVIDTSQLAAGSRIELRKAAVEKTPASLIQTITT